MLDIVMLTTLLKLQLEMLQSGTLPPERARNCAALLEYLADYKDGIDCQTGELPDQMVMELKAVAMKLRQE